jgi:hypothetical protein
VDRFPTLAVAIALRGCARVTFDGTSPATLDRITERLAVLLVEAGDRGRRLRERFEDLSRRLDDG